MRYITALCVLRLDDSKLTNIERLWVAATTLVVVGVKWSAIRLLRDGGRPYSRGNLSAIRLLREGEAKF